MSGGDDARYQVRDRVEGLQSRAPKLAVIAAGVVGAIWLVAAMTAPAPQVDPAAAIALADRAIPVLGSNDRLSWLETADGTIRRADDRHQPQWLFLWADGSTLCVCRLPGTELAETPWALRTYGLAGELTSSIALPDWPAKPGFSTVTDVALDAANRLLYVAWGQLAPDGRWMAGLDQVRIDDGTRRTAEIGTGRKAEDSGPEMAVELWLAPDGEHARLRFALTQAWGRGVRGTWKWNVPIGPWRPDQSVLVELPDDLRGENCGAVGWATPRDFVTTCSVRPPEDTFTMTTIIHSSSLDGTERQLDAGHLGGWNITSQATGQMFGWSPESHTLTRVDVPSLELHSQRVVDIGVQAQAPWPEPRSDLVAWAPRGLRPQGYNGGRSIVGAPDGTVVYAASSTRIWAFDTASLAVVGHWPAAAAYETLAVTPDGDYVIAVGRSTRVPAGQPGDRVRTVTLHDARTGAIALIVRGVADLESFLVPEPYPGTT